MTSTKANRIESKLLRRINERRLLEVIQHKGPLSRAALARVSPEFRVQTESHRLLSLWKRLQAASPASVSNAQLASGPCSKHKVVMVNTQIF
jgi:exodeoxyribonuclease VII large subunit